MPLPCLPSVSHRTTPACMGAAPRPADVAAVAARMAAVPSAHARAPAARGLVLALALALGMAALAGAPRSVMAASSSVAWRSAGADSDIESAFKLARESKKPVLLYWGAKWCPPCNQLKATLFNRQDFIELSESVVPVHIDGDNAGAQKLGARFKVRGYPTLILFGPEGQEITRLPGEADAAQVVKLIQLGLAGGRPVSRLLADARSGKKLTANEWRALSFYGWETDEQQLLSAAERPAVLGRLSVGAQSVEPEAATRLWLKSLAGAEGAKPIAPDLAAAQRLTLVLADAAQARAHMDVLSNNADDLVRAVTPPGESRQALVAAFDAAMQKLQADATLSRADRLSALQARVELARVDQDPKALQPRLPAGLAKAVKAQVGKDDVEITDGYERQAVITGGAHVLGLAGLWADSDALLKANLVKSHSPYYLMNQLGSNARKQGRHDDALSWYEQAWARSEGPATRMQWGAGYLAALVELSPKAGERIEKTARTILEEAAKDRAAFYERNARSLKRVGTSLQAWGEAPANAPALARLRSQLEGICGKVDAADNQRATCEGLLPATAPAPTKKSG